MTLRETLGSVTARVHDQVDLVLDGEDAIIILIGPRRVATYVHGFGMSGCQLELLSCQVERAVRALAPVPSTHDTGNRHAHPHDPDRGYRPGVAGRRGEGVRSRGPGADDIPPEVRHCCQ